MHLEHCEQVTWGTFVVTSVRIDVGTCRSEENNLGGWTSARGCFKHLISHRFSGHTWSVLLQGQGVNLAWVLSPGGETELWSSVLLSDLSGGRRRAARTDFSM
jgi:hypothetical protein